MAFSFGATPAPAPAAGGGGFGGFGAPAPAPGGGAPAPAPSTSLFGAPAPAPAAGGGGLFGAPAPAPAAGGGGLFGAPAAAGGGLFGSTPAPAAAPAGGGLFGSAAPAAGGLFGSTAPAPATGAPFGAPAPAPAAGGLFGATPAAAPATLQQQQYPQMPLSGNTPYSQLPDNAKRAIDQIYQLMMQHRRTLASVKTMAPSLLDVEDGAIARQNLGIGGELPSPADAAAGSPRRPEAVARDTLKGKTAALRNQIQDLLRSAESNLAGAEELKVRAGEAAAAAKVHGAWPVEGVAARRGVALSTAPAPGPAPTAGGAASSANVTGMPDAEAAILQRVLDARAARVDRVEAMPSPYFWEVLRDFERRVEAVHRDVEAVRSRLAVAEEAERLLRPGARADEASATGLVPYDGGVGAADAPLPRRLAALARSQNDLFLRTAARAAHAHDALEQAKARYQRLARASRGGWYDDPFLRADAEEVRREREVRDRIAEERLATAPPPPAAPVAAPAAGGAFGQPAPAPVTGGLFGAPAPAAGGGLFGQPAPAPAAGGLFGTPAPAPAGGLFGAPTPAPAPVGAGLFGSTATPTPAPAGGGLFGSTATPAPAPAGGGLFGSTATPAPAAGGGLFGSAAPAPVFGAAPTTPASTLAPRKKSGSRSGRRR